LHTESQADNKAEAIKYRVIIAKFVMQQATTCMWAASPQMKLNLCVKRQVD